MGIRYFLNETLYSEMTPGSAVCATHIDQGDSSISGLNSLLAGGFSSPLEVLLSGLPKLFYMHGFW